MKIPKYCVECEIQLTAANRAESDPLAAFCKTCWSKREPWVPKCPDCDLELIQDSMNAFRIFCPALCKSGEIWLKPYN